MHSIGTTLIGSWNSFSEDATFDMPRGPQPWGTRFIGKKEVRKGLETRFSGIPDFHYGEDRHWVCGDRGVSELLLIWISDVSDGLC